MARTMQCVVWQGRGKVEIEERPVPEPGLGEVLVKILTNGICSSDFPIVQGKVEGSFPGMVLGHEPVGRVVSTNAGRLVVGQRVALDTMLACGKCRFCHEGHPEWCVDSKEIGFSVDGCYSAYAVFPEANLHILPV